MGSEEPPQCPFDHVDGLGLEPQLRHLLLDEPVARVRLAYGEGPAWIATRYDDVKLVSSDRRFSRAALVGMDFARITPEPIAPPGSIFVLDPPEHTALRSALGRAFAPRAMERMQEQTQVVVDDLLDELEGGGHPADLMSALATPLPTKVISRVLGLSETELDVLKRCAASLKITHASSRAAALEAQKTLREQVTLLVQRRQRHPGDDLVSLLAHAPDDEQQLGNRELESLTTSLLLTGHDNVTNEVGSICYTLLTDQGLLDRARQGIDTILDELFRSIPYRRGVGTPRVALEDVEVGGTLIRSGDIIHVSYIAANQDPDRFPSPDDIDPDRPRVPNLAFGWGTHRCPAEPLARIEVAVAVSTLLTRFPGLQLAVPPQDVAWDKQSVNRLPVELPVTW